MEQLLEGKEIFITREKSKAKSLADLIVELGGVPVQIPLVKVTCKSFAVERLEKFINYEWIIFTSANGVDCFFKQLNQQELDLIKSNTPKFAVVGHKTEKALHEYGLSASFLPSVYNAKTLAIEFLQRIPLKGPLLIVKGSKSLNVIQEDLVKHGVGFDEVISYKTMSDFDSQATLKNYLNKRYPDYLTFTSPSAVDAFLEMGIEAKHIEKLKDLPCVCIGTTTESRAIENGFNQTMSPNYFTIEGIVNTISHYIKRKDRLQ